MIRGRPIFCADLQNLNNIRLWVGGCVSENQVYRFPVFLGFTKKMECECSLENNFVERIVKAV